MEGQKEQKGRKTASQRRILASGALADSPRCMALSALFITCPRDKQVGGLIAAAI